VVPTRSMSVVRKHFWQVVTRGYFGGTLPQKMSLNWTMPAEVKSKVGVGSSGTREEEGRITWSLPSKNSRNARLSSRESIIMRILA